MQHTINHAITPPHTAYPSRDCKPRFRHIDMARGFFVMWVVAMHLSLQIPDFDSGYRMPAMFAISAIFFNPTYPPEKFLKRKYEGLVIPFFFFWAISIIFKIINHGVETTSASFLETINEYSYLNVNILWFIAVLILYNFGFYFLFNLKWSNTKIGRATILISCLPIYLIGMLLFKKGVNIPFLPLNEILCFAIFFVLGFYFKTYIRNIGNNIAHFIIALAIFIACCINIHFNYVVPFAANNFIGAISLTVCIIFIFRKIQKWWICEVFKFFGEYSIVLYITHMLIIYIPPIRAFWESTEINSLERLTTFIVLLIVEVPLTLALNRYCPKLIGKRLKSVQQAA